MTGQMHPCPGGCGRRQIRVWPCRTCRQRLPEPIRQRVEAVDDAAEPPSSALYQETFAAAAKWLRDNPGVQVVIDAATEMRILTHYAAGTQIFSIAAICHVDRDVVLDIIDKRAGFSRDRARALLTPEPVRRRPAIAKRHREEPLPATEPELAPAASLEQPAAESEPAALDVVQPPEAADVEPAAQEPDPEPDEPAASPASTEGAADGLAPDPGVDDVDQVDQVSATHLVDAPAQATPPVKPLFSYDAWLCQSCGSRRYDPGTCCRRWTTPITVTITPRAA